MKASTKKTIRPCERKSIVWQAIREQGCEDMQYNGRVVIHHSAPVRRMAHGYWVQAWIWVASDEVKL